MKCLRKMISRDKYMELTKTEKIQAKVKAYELALSVRQYCDGENIDNKANDIYKWLIEE